jgi:DNA-binding HxlR family transcriptional regulator
LKSRTRIPETMVSLGPIPERPADEAPHGDACECVVCGLLDLLGRKWTGVVLGQLRAGEPVRFNELKREVGGISPRVLSDRLDELEEAGLVERIDHGTDPPKVEYTLTEAGRGLGNVLDDLVSWAEEHA